MLSQSNGFQVSQLFGCAGVRGLRFGAGAEVVATDGLSFSLCPGQKEPTVYGLPVYFTGSGQRVKQVLLTPFAIATDLTVVGGVVCLIVCYVEANRCP